MYKNLFKLLIEGLTTGGDPELTGWRLGNAKGGNRIKSRKSRDELSSLGRIAGKLEKRRMGASSKVKVRGWHTDKDYKAHRKLVGPEKVKYRGDAAKNFLYGLKSGVKDGIHLPESRDDSLIYASKKSPDWNPEKTRQILKNQKRLKQLISMAGTNKRLKYRNPEAYLKNLKRQKQYYKDGKYYSSPEKHLPLPKIEYAKKKKIKEGTTTGDNSYMTGKRIGNAGSFKNRQKQNNKYDDYSAKKKDPIITHQRSPKEAIKRIMDKLVKRGAKQGINHNLIKKQFTKGYLGG